MHVGIVTRRPLVLQLHRIDEGREYAEFMHVPRKRFTDFGMSFASDLFVKFISLLPVTFAPICFFVHFRTRAIYVYHDLTDMIQSHSFLPVGSSLKLFSILMYIFQCFKFNFLTGTSQMLNFSCILCSCCEEGDC